MNGVMKQSVADTCFVYAPKFGVFHQERCIAAVPICSPREVVVKIEEIFFQIGGEGKHILLFLLVFYKLAPRGKEIAK